MAVCRVDEASTLTEEQVIAHVADRMGSYLKPTRVEYVHEPLPKTVVGKLMRRALREPHWKDRDSRVGRA
jgi:acyl-coenzyme A synthetase/AMP-(fatty) acid ligase